MTSPRTFTNKEIKLLHAALKAIPHETMDVKTRWDVATNISVLQRLADVIEQVSGSHLTAHGLVDGEQLTDQNRGRISNFTADLKTLLAQDVEVDGLVLLERSRLEKLPIPPAVISVIVPLIAP